MCGLLAYFSTDADRVDDDTVAAVREAQHCMRHRGPDENEAWWDGRAVFGFNRLSFIDIEHSHQPMPYADGGTGSSSTARSTTPRAAGRARRGRRDVRHRG